MQREQTLRVRTLDSAAHRLPLLAAEAAALPAVGKDTGKARIEAIFGSW
jgi:hypothetical protein